MDFSQGTGRPTAPTTRPGTQEAPSQAVSSGKSGKAKKGRNFSPLRIASVVLLFSTTILVVALLLYIGFGKGGSSSLVKEDQYQAVFLNGGQVYFGKLKYIDNKDIQMSDIFYLKVNQQVQPDAKASTSSQDISLAKLGNELHGPDDVMVINRDQVLFWENLKDDGQVVKAITEYKKNPSAATTPAATATPTPTTKK